MASYGALLRKITTAEINRVQREGHYSRHAYFIDESTAKVGVVFANDTTFAAYTVEDEPDPKLHFYGLEPIKKLVLMPNEQLLILAAGDNVFEAVVFNDPATVYEDEFLESFVYDAVPEWQDFMEQHGVGHEAKTFVGNAKIVLGVIILAIVIFMVLALVTGSLSPGSVVGH
jgi:hypothetical protein